jgi:type IV fimbrial biogenesis protein FimT
MNAHGITIVELLLAIALIAISLGLVVPGFLTLSHTTTARFEAERLLSSLELARSHAVFRAARVTLCAADEAGRAAGRCGGHFDDGWLLTVRQRDLRSATDADITLLRKELAPARGYTIRQQDGVRAAVAPLTFRADGTTGLGATFRICLPVGVSAAGWRVVVSATGRPRLQRDLVPCPAPATAL